MHKPSNLRDYAISFVLATALTVFLGAYLFLRRGYMFDGPDTVDVMYVPNKAIVGTGTVLLAFTFLIGPITRYFDRFDSLLQYRKEIGIVGGFFALFHAIISYFFLPLKFPREWFDFQTVEFGAGLIGAFLLIFLFIISFEKMIRLLGGGRWWFLQRLGLRLVIFFTLVHVYAMKWNGWVKWIKQGGTTTSSPELVNPWLPGAGILVSMFITWVVIVRLYETLFLYKDFGFKTKEIVMDSVLRERGRKFFIRSSWILGALWVFVITRFWW